MVTAFILQLFMFVDEFWASVKGQTVYREQSTREPWVPGNSGGSEDVGGVDDLLALAAAESPPVERKWPV